jgi:hypothetical protein
MENMKMPLITSHLNGKDLDIYQDNDVFTFTYGKNSVAIDRHLLLGDEKIIRPYFGKLLDLIKQITSIKQEQLAIFAWCGGVMMSDWK